MCKANLLKLSTIQMFLMMLIYKMQLMQLIKKLCLKIVRVLNNNKEMKMSLLLKKLNLNKQNRGNLKVETLAFLLLALEKDL